MKKLLCTLLLITALFLLREEYQPHSLSAFNWRDGKTIYQKVYVIGDKSGHILFCVPTGEETKWFTPKEAAEHNKALNLSPQKSRLIIIPQDIIGGDALKNK